MNFKTINQQLLDLPSTFKRQGATYAQLMDSITAMMVTYTNAADNLLAQTDFNNAEYGWADTWGSLAALLRRGDESDIVYKQRILNMVLAWHGTIPAMVKWISLIEGVDAAINESFPNIGYQLSIPPTLTPAQVTQLIKDLAYVRPAGVPFGFGTNSFSGGSYLATVNFFGEPRTTGAYLTGILFQSGFTNLLPISTNNVVASLPDLLFTDPVLNPNFVPPLTSNAPFSTGTFVLPPPPGPPPPPPPPLPPQPPSGQLLTLLIDQSSAANVTSFQSSFTVPPAPLSNTSPAQLYLFGTALATAASGISGASPYLAAQIFWSGVNYRVELVTPGLGIGSPILVIGQTITASYTNNSSGSYTVSVTGSGFTGFSLTVTGMPTLNTVYGAFLQEVSSITQHAQLPAGFSTFSNFSLTRSGSSGTTPTWNVYNPPAKNGEIGSLSSDNSRFFMYFGSGQAPGATSGVTTSPNNTVMPPASQIVDLGHNVWTIQNQSLYLNNNLLVAGGTNFIWEVVYFNTVIYAALTLAPAFAAWYRWTGSTWTKLVGDPRLIPSMSAQENSFTTLIFDEEWDFGADIGKSHSEGGSGGHKWYDNLTWNPVNVGGLSHGSYQLFSSPNVNGQGLSITTFANQNFIQSLITTDDGTGTGFFLPTTCFIEMRAAFQGGDFFLGLTNTQMTSGAFNPLLKHLTFLQQDENRQQALTEYSAGINSGVLTQAFGSLTSLEWNNWGFYKSATSLIVYKNDVFTEAFNYDGQFGNLTVTDPFAMIFQAFQDGWSRGPNSLIQSTLSLDYIRVWV